MITSVRENMTPGSRYHFHLFYSDLASWEEQVIQRLNNKDNSCFVVSLRKLKPEDNLFSSLPKCRRHGQAALMRLNLPHLLPDVDRVLYLDGDMLVQGDLTELYSAPLDDNLLAGVRDSFYFAAKPPTLLEHFPPMSYINSGVLVMDLAKMRQENTTQRFLAVAPEVTKFWLCPDQDIINYACVGRIKYLHPKYNWITVLREALGQEKRRARYNKVHQVDYKSSREIESEAVIFHFLGGRPAKRPWEYINGAYATQWLHYFLKSPVSHLELALCHYEESTGAKQSCTYSDALSQTLNGVTRYTLCGCLTLLTICSTWDPESDRLKKRIKLFGIIPILSSRGTRRSIQWKLFNCFPIWKKDVNFEAKK